jgi:type IV secretion system protein TrbL
LRIFNVGSAYTARRTSKTAWVGAIVVVMWYWIGSVSLYLVEALTIALLPSVQSVATAMTNLLTVSISNPALAFVVAAVGGLSMWALEAFLYIRQVLLYGMPIAIALAYGNVPVVADIADGFCKRFIPLAVLPLPAAIVFRGYDLLYGQGILSPTTLYLQFLVAASLPVVALLLSWKTFQYATPLTARALATTTQTVGTVGAVAVGGSVAGPTVARTVAYRGTRQAMKRETVRRVSKQFEQDDEHQPRYRRTKNDP